MGNLFDDCDEYPDYRPIPRYVVTVSGQVVPLAIAATMFGLCPREVGHVHPPHADHHPGSLRVSAYAMSSSTGVVLTPSTGSLSFQGHAPTVLIRPN